VLGDKIDYNAVAGKSRCVSESVDNYLNIWGLRWSGRRDSNPRPSGSRNRSERLWNPIEIRGS